MAVRVNLQQVGFLFHQVEQESLPTQNDESDTTGSLSGLEAGDARSTGSPL